MYIQKISGISLRVFPKDLISAYLEITTAVLVPCGGPKISPCTSIIVLLYLYFLVVWDCRIQHLLESRVELNPGLGVVRDVASAIISHEQTQ